MRPATRPRESLAVILPRPAGMQNTCVEYSNPRIISRGTLRKCARITAQSPTWRGYSCLQRRDSGLLIAWNCLRAASANVPHIGTRLGVRGFLVRGSTRVSTRQAGVPAPRRLGIKCEVRQREVEACRYCKAALKDFGTFSGGRPVRLFYRSYDRSGRWQSRYRETDERGSVEEIEGSTEMKAEKLELVRGSGNVFRDLSAR